MRRQATTEEAGRDPRNAPSRDDPNYDPRKDDPHSFDAWWNDDGQWEHNPYQPRRETPAAESGWGGTAVARGSRSGERNGTTSPTPGPDDTVSWRASGTGTATQTTKPDQTTSWRASDTSTATRPASPDDTVSWSIDQADDTGTIPSYNHRSVDTSTIPAPTIPAPQSDDTSTIPAYRPRPATTQVGTTPAYREARPAPQAQRPAPQAQQQRQSSPSRHRPGPPPSVRPTPVNQAGRIFFVIVFWFTLVTSVELWWLDTPAGSISSTADILIAVGRITGMVGGFILLFQVLMMSRAGWLERWIGAHDLLIWHRELGSYLLLTVLTHVAATIVGYAWATDTPVTSETWTMVTTFEDMLSATAATAILVVVGVLSIRAVRRMMKYETWYYVHLASYLVLVLGYGHQFSAGQELMNGGFARWYWLGLYLFVLGNLAWGRAIGPLILNFKHRLRVAAVVPEGPDMISIYISGRDLDQMKARAGQYFRWRFLTSGSWWQAHPFSLSAAPNHKWLRLTVKVVGDHTEELQFMEPGVRVFAEGPSGVFTADRSIRRRALLIAGGSGIAPIRALLEDLPAGTIMIYRASKDADLVFRDELDWLARERGAYVWYVLGGRDDPGPKHLFTPKGMRQLVPDVSRRDVFLCGPQGLVSASVQTLRKLRVPKRQLHLDPFEF